MTDMIIVGGGPAGMGAAIYAVRAGLSVKLIEQSPVCGGQMLSTYDIDNYLGLPGMGGIELGQKFREHCDRLEVTFIEAAVERFELQSDVKKIYLENGGIEESRTVVLAMGASHSKLGVPGEEELAGMGVSYCATCDGAFFKGKDVAVVGGGDVAVGDAIFLARKCSKVYVIHRRDALRAAGSLQKKLFGLSNVEMVWKSTADSINGSEQVESITVANKNDGTKRDINVSGVFIATGINPNTELCRDQIKCDDRGYIIAGEDCAASIPGVYAAGDIRGKALRQIITAVADGANAVTSAQRYMDA
jgi:thioredoxin reductase (NADPH)